MAENSQISYKSLFQYLVEAVPLPMLIIDADMHIRAASQQVRALFKLEELPDGQSLQQFVENAAILQLIQQGIQSRSSLSGEFKQTGGSIWKVSVTPLQHWQTPQEKRSVQGPAPASPPLLYRYYSIAIEDLSALRRLERIQSDFIANISHELRTPLSSVRLLAETLEDVVETDPDKAQMFVEKIENEVQHLSDLVAELLELSLIESGRVSINLEPVEAEMLVREIMARMLTLAQRHRVALRTQIEQGQTMVAADSKQIARVLVNLVHNAIKFTPSGGTIVIGTSCQPGETCQSFFVRDTGVGISAEDLSRIFERFYKVSQSRSRRDFIGPGGGGSGLGLAIAHHVVEAHGGHIFATSTPGQGSTFTFTLPITNVATK
jgi:two-component system phosphate regulon sensor histidine kinase PhoR